VRLFEWNSDSFAGYQSKLPGFVNYLSGVWQNRNRYVEPNEELSEEELQKERIQRQLFFDFTIDGKISARNFVGVVQYEGIRIEVYPKIFAENEVENTKLWQINMLYWFSYCRKVRFPFSFADISKLQFDDFLEMLIYIFANYTEDVISNQPFQAYQNINEETAFLKGHISFEEYTKNNLSTGKWQNFYCKHEPFIYDNLFNRIVKYVTKRLLAVSENSLNKQKLNEILFILNDVSDIPCSANDCDKVKLNPLFAEHKLILDLSKMYLSNQVIDLEDEDSNNFCFLLPMEYIFEDFIFGFISEYWPELNIKSQSTDFLALSKGSSVFQIRNDIYIPDKLVIDTKYKIRSNNDGLKAGVAQSDLYQMVSYALRRNCVDVLLLYPYSISASNTPTLFQIPSNNLDEEINIYVKNIDITFDDINYANELIQARINSIHQLFGRETI
jgi:5-methylcytosine-specific restriction enzyme subunit McrC